MIQEKVRNFIVSELNFSGAPEELTDDYPLLEKEVIDSMGIFQIVSFLEDEVGVEVDDEDLVPENFASIGHIAKLVEDKR